MASQTAKESARLYKRLIGYARPYAWAFFIAVGANIIFSGVDSLFTYMLKPILDKGFIAKDYHFLKWLPIVIPALFLLRALMNFVGSYAMTWVGRNVVMNFRRMIFSRYLQLPASFYDHNSSGELLSKMIYNTSQVANACTDVITTLVQSSFLVIGLLTVMLLISWRLTLVFFMTAPFIALVVKLSSRRLRRLSREVQNSMAEITHVAEEAIEGYKVVRIFGGEEYEFNKFKKATARNLRLALKITVTKALSGSGVQFLGVIALTIMVAIATSGTTMSLTAGGFAALLTAMLALLKPIRALTQVNAKIQKGLAGAESIFELMDEPSEADHGTERITRVKGDIQLRNLNFHYPAHEDKTILHDINIHIKPGEVAALVGRSGSGKSTLISLLTRFYDHVEGDILIDGMDVKDIHLLDLRRQFSLVSQNVTLFNDTIFNNICYGRFEEASEEEVIRAAEMAHAMEFIQNFREGIHTLVGENGVLLSGGQRQRIAIARAILKDAPILILDEATASLDTESERIIQTALETVMQNRTTLVIAHRLSTIEKADQIIVLDQGKILEIGTHQELLEKEGGYAKLYRLQFSQEPVEAL